jgi:hypothetical protein
MKMHFKLETGMRHWIVIGVLLAAPLCAQQQDQQQDESSNPIVDDTVKLADAGGLLKYEIGGFGPCSFFAKRGTRWHKSFADGSVIELKCDPDAGHFLPGFHLWYKGPGGARIEIGRCIFDDGFNRGWYYTSADMGSVTRIVWQNIDGGKNDGGGRHIDREHVTGPEEPYLDVVRWIFDARTHSLQTVSDKYEYRTKPPGLPADPQAPLDAYIGPLVGELRRSFVKDLAY